MTPGDIIAFEVTGEPRPARNGEWYRDHDGMFGQWTESDPTRGIYTIIRPIPSPEIAEHLRVLAAVAKWRTVLLNIECGFVTVEEVKAMAKEILGS